MRFVKLFICFAVFLAVIVVYFLFWPKESQPAATATTGQLCVCNTEVPSGGNTGSEQNTEAKANSEAEDSMKDKEEEAKAKAEAMNKEIKDYFASVEKKLTKDDLSFDEVKTSYAEFLAKSAKWSQEPVWKDYEGTVKKIKAYKKVVDVLTREWKTQEEFNALVDDIKDLAPSNQVMQALNEKHRIDVLYIYWGDYSVRPPREYAYESLRVYRNGIYRICPPGQRADYDNNEWGVDWFVKKRVEKKYNTFKSLYTFKNKRSYYDMLPQ